MKLFTQIIPHLCSLDRYYGAEPGRDQVSSELIFLAILLLQVFIGV
jgi:hypothetical protein